MPDDSRQALLTRITELLESPTLVPLVDYYIDRLISLDRKGDTNSVQW